MSILSKRIILSIGLYICVFFASEEAYVFLAHRAGGPFLGVWQIVMIAVTLAIASMGGSMLIIRKKH